MPDRRGQQRLVGGLRIDVVTSLCDRLENEVWVSEGRLELESKELEVGRRGGGWACSYSPLPWWSAADAA